MAAVSAALGVAAVCASAAGAPTDSPRITDASMHPIRFAVNHHGSPEVQAGVAHGTTFHYRLSKPAKVFFFLDRGAKGRVVGGHCRRQSPRNKRFRACSFYVSSGSFREAGLQGKNVKQFSGRIGKRNLPPALYKAHVVAVDSMGNPSTPKVLLRFRILRG